MTTKAVVPTSRVRRAATLAGAGLDTFKRSRATDETIRANASAHLAERLGRLRGLPQKMGQLLSMSGGDETDPAFEALAQSAQPVPLDDLLPVLSAAWGCDPTEVCAEIKPTGIAASLGQVQRATLHDGREVAIKIQYPGIRKAIEADLKMLGWLSEPVGGLRRGFDLESYRRAIGDSLDDELDYVGEAARQQAYAVTSAELGIVVPRIVPELSSERVLVSTWEDGQTLAQARGWPAKSRAALGRLVMRHSLTMLFEHGLLHADPHPGNYRFRETPDGPVIVLYDFGCVRELNVDQRLTLLRLIHDTNNNPLSDPYPLFIKLGFGADTLEPLRAKLPALCRVLFDPFSTPMKFDLKYWKRGERISDILADDRWNFRISAPASLIFVMRAFHGLIYYLEQLQEPVSWTQFYRPIIATHESKMARLELPVPSDPATSFGTLAQHLLIRVTRDGATKAKVTLPAAAVDDLESVIDDDVRERIESRGISIPELVRQVRTNRYAPQRLFELDDGTKRFEVWLE